MLGVAETATTDEVKKAFRALAREVHPDVAGEDPKIAERFKTIRKAYEVLVDPTSRQRYDRRRRGPTRETRTNARSWRTHCPTAAKLVDSACTPRCLPSAERSRPLRAARAVSSMI